MIDDHPNQDLENLDIQGLTEKKVEVQENAETKAKKEKQNKLREKISKGFSVKNLKKYFKNQKLPIDSEVQFVDQMFPPNRRSLLGLNENDMPIDPKQYERSSKAINPKQITWKRIKDIFPECALFENKIEFSDIKQGSLGNCYFLSALAALTEFPNLITKIFKSKETSEIGLYEVALFIDGEWQIVIVDDYIPYDKETETFAFTQPNGIELWVLILEKAWAKINGGYLNIIGGIPSEPLTALTGFSVRTVKTDEISIEKLWKIINKSDKQDFVMCCNSRVLDPNDKTYSESIVTQHAYTLISAKQVEYKGEKIRLFKIRNPWGNKEWDGDWSDKSEKWNDELIDLFDVKGSLGVDDGTFLMTPADFVRYFDSINICCYMFNSYSKNFEITKKDFDIPQVFTFYLPDEKFVSISAHGQYWRYNRHLIDKESPISVLLAKVEENNEISYVDSNFSGTEDAYIVKKLNPGYYIIWVYYSKNDNNQRLITDYNMQICAESLFKAKHFCADHDFRILQKIIISGFKKDYKDEISRSENYSRMDLSYKKSGIAYLIRINNSKAKYFRNVVEFPDVNGYLLLPPYEGKSKVDIFSSPGSAVALFAIRSREVGEFSFNLASSLMSKNSPFKNDPTNGKIKEELLNLYNKDLINEEVKDNYYQFVTPNITKAKKVTQFPKVNINDVTKKALLIKHLDLMQYVLIFKPKNKEIFERLKEEKKQELRVIEWKKKKISNGFYLAEFNEKEQLHGLALFKFNEGNFFVGLFENDKKVYCEEYDINSVLIFSGKFKDGKKQGTCYFNYSNGFEFEGKYEDDVRISGTLWSGDEKKYKGEYLNDKFHGKGKIYTKDGEYWEGDFENGMKNGEGVYYFKDKTTKTIVFKNNQRVKQ